MSPTTKDRKFRSPEGTKFQPSGIRRIGADGFAKAIATALHKEYGAARGAVKIVVGQTAANERAVKNWFAGHNGPSGEFLILLCRHSDEVMETVLLLAGRAELITAKKFVDAKAKLREMLSLIDELEAQLEKAHST